MILTKIHRCVKFTQRAWLEPWIRFNNDKRTEATNAKNEFENDSLKLMNNVVLGKTVENVRGHCDFELVCDGQRLENV